MITIDEMGQILDEIAEELPKDFFARLNGGIILLPDVKMHDAGAADDLYTLGEYNRGGALGRYITIFYGSYMKVHGDAPRSRIKALLTDTLLHEFTHHLESLAGERGLEVKDELQIAAHISRHRKRK